MLRAKARNAALERDGYRCTRCGKTQEQAKAESLRGHGLEVHHRSGASVRADHHDLDDLLTLCRDCHLDTIRPRSTRPGARRPPLLLAEPRSASRVAAQRAHWISSAPVRDARVRDARELLALAAGVRGLSPARPDPHRASKHPPDPLRHLPTSTTSPLLTAPRNSEADHRVPQRARRLGGASLQRRGRSASRPREAGGPLVPGAVAGALRTGGCPGPGRRPRVRGVDASSGRPDSRCERRARPRQARTTRGAGSPGPFPAPCGPLALVRTPRSPRASSGPRWRPWAPPARSGRGASTPRSPRWSCPARGCSCCRPGSHLRIRPRARGLAGVARRKVSMPAWSCHTSTTTVAPSSPTLWTCASRPSPQSERFVMGCPPFSSRVTRSYTSRGSTPSHGANSATDVMGTAALLSGRVGRSSLLGSRVLKPVGQHGSSPRVAASRWRRRTSCPAPWR